MDSNLSAAFGHLNFNEGDLQHVLDNTWNVDDPTLFNFAASLDPPSIDPTAEPWGVPVRIGVTWATWTDASLIPMFPTEVGVENGSLYLPHGGPQVGTEYALMWAQMGGQIPVTDPMTLYQNWSFPFAVPGQQTWIPNTSFPEDTWGNASIIPFVTYGPNPWSLDLSEVQPDGSLSPKDFEGFALISGDTIIVGVDMAAMLTNGAAGLTYGFAGHIHDGGFGASPQSMSLVSFATGTPGNLISVPPPTLLDIGTTVAPSTTSTTSSTTTTVGGATTSTTLAASQPEAGGETGSGADDGLPILAIILGLVGVVVVIIGGRMIFAKADDPCVELLKAWEAAQRACDDARAKADSAKENCDEAEQQAADLEKKVNDLCKKWPPACEGEGASAEISGDPGSRVTSRDLHARRVALGRLWDDYQNGDVSAQDVENAWKRADTPEFREEMRRTTEQKIAEREKLEREIKEAKEDAHDKCEKANELAEAADSACDAAKKAKDAYDDCIKEQTGKDFVNAFMDLGSGTQAETAAPEPPASQAQQTSVVAPAAQPQRKVGVPVPISLSTSGMSEDEATRARKLEQIFGNRRGTGDIAAVALDLYQFNNWHLKTFGEPWYTWSTGERNPNSPTATAETSQRFMQTRVMACYEFVHFCAYIASDQLGRQRISGDEDNPIFLDEYSVDWGFADEINTNTQALTGQAPRGSVITGSYRWGSYDNSAGYYHTGISIGDGKAISLGSDGLILEDATGALDAAFPSAGYNNVQFGDYSYGRNNPAPAGP